MASETGGNGHYPTMHRERGQADLPRSVSLRRPAVDDGAGDSRVRAGPAPRFGAHPPTCARAPRAQRKGSHAPVRAIQNPRGLEESTRRGSRRSVEPDLVHASVLQKLQQRWEHVVLPRCDEEPLSVRSARGGCRS